MISWKPCWEVKKCCSLQKSFCCHWLVHCICVLGLLVNLKQHMRLSEACLVEAKSDNDLSVECNSMSTLKLKLWALEMIKLVFNQRVEKGVYHVESYTIQYTTLTRLRWHTLPAAKGATYYTGVNVQGDHWTGSILRSSLQDLIDWHRFLRRYLVVFKVSFHGEVVLPGVTATSVLTSAKCQRHTSSIWPWSGAPKVHL